MFDIGKILGSVGDDAQENAQANQQQPQQMPSPTSAFVEAARQANLERQQAAQMQVQTAPTALAGQQMMAGQPQQQPQGISPPPGGMVTMGTPDQQALANMYRMQGF